MILSAFTIEYIQTKYFNCLKTETSPKLMSQGQSKEATWAEQLLYNDGDAPAAFLSDLTNYIYMTL